MTTRLNQLEEEWLEFLSRRLAKPLDRLESVFLETRERFLSDAREYRELLRNLHYLYRLIHDPRDERELLEIYRRHDFAHCLLMLSYSYRKRPRWYVRCLSVLRRAARGDFTVVARHAMRRLTGAPSDTGTRTGIARFLLDTVGDAPVVVDYGCGLAHLSFEIAKLDPRATVHLVDIDCLSLDFARFRFEKHGLRAETIAVSAEDLYPRLPPHDLCIASEVMEHVIRPLEIYGHIVEALRPGGALHGAFDDHRSGILHVSPDLAALRGRIERDFKRVGSRTYLRPGPTSRHPRILGEPGGGSQEDAPPPRGETGLTPPGG